MSLERVYRIMFFWVVVSVSIFALVGCGKSKNPSKAATTDARPQLIDEGLDKGDVTVHQVPDRPSTMPSKHKHAAGKNNPVRILVSDKHVNKQIKKAKAGQPVVYTTASGDPIINELRRRLAAEPNAQNRREDLEFAQQIGLVQVRYDLRNSSMTVTALIKENGVSRYFDFTGTMTRDFSAVVGNANLSPNMTANVKCLDAQGGCNTVRVRFNDHRRNRVAYVVVRQTAATLVIPTQTPFESANLERKLFANMLFNSINNQCQPNTVCGITLNTSETVNGSSTFLLALRMKFADMQGGPTHEQLVEVNGPLASVTKGAIPATTNRSEIFRSAALIANDGNGTLGLALTFRAQNAGERDETMAITVQRDHRPVVLNDL